MTIIVADDENIILQTEAAMIKEILPDAEVRAFADTEEILKYAKEHVIDIAFLDINLEADNGIEIAKKLQAFHPKINIIFCTGYSEYSLEALELYCSAYLMKPVSEEKIERALRMLRYPVEHQMEKLSVKCFGNFEVTYKGNPVKFKYAKTKEMLAYLIDRDGVMLSLREIMAVIFEEDDKESYMRNIKADMINTFQTIGIGSVLIQEWGKIGINKEMVKCDYYDYLRGDKHLFHGEYMSQYSFAETTLSALVQ